MNNLSIKQEIERRKKLFNAITYVDIAIDVTAGVWGNTPLTKELLSLIEIKYRRVTQLRSTFGCYFGHQTYDASNSLHKKTVEVYSAFFSGPIFLSYE